jgi:catechol 2,3-dioxygenase-like lactoylglutathione lyase family enzyme
MKPILSLTIGAAFLVLAACADAAPTHETPAQTASTANPIAVSGDIPTDVRRTTVIVRDMERSLTLYRDVLGLEVNYDAAMMVRSPAFTQFGEPRPIRLVLLNGNDPWIGWIGLIQYTDKPTEPETPLPEYLGPGSHIFVLNVRDADDVCARAEALPGVRMLNPLGIATYPGRDGGPPIQVKGCQFFEFDGAYLELNQRIEPSAATE